MARNSGQLYLHMYPSSAVGPSPSTLKQRNSAVFGLPADCNVVSTVRGGVADGFPPQERCFRKVQYFFHLLHCCDILSGARCLNFSTVCIRTAPDP